MSVICSDCHKDVGVGSHYLVTHHLKCDVCDEVKEWVYECGCLIEEVVHDEP